MEKSSLLLVEGYNDKSVIQELCKINQIDVRFEIKAENSITKLKTALKTYLKSTNQYRKIWIIIDADNSVECAWQSVRDILILSGRYDINHKTQLKKNGLIISPKEVHDITIGVWIMPNNTNIGMLEDFLIRLIPENDKLIEKSRKIISKLDAERNLHNNLFKSVHKSKAQVHTWLAWHDTPGTSLNVAIQKRLFQNDTELCNEFNAWLSQLND